jgi:hypothetical protein
MLEQHERHHDQRHDGQDHDKGTKIIVNGRPKVVNEKELSFMDIVKLASDPVPTEQFIIFTITYRRGHGHKPEGTLLQGQSVKVREGMIFNVTATDKS